MCNTELQFFPVSPHFIYKLHNIGFEYLLKMLLLLLRYIIIVLKCIIIIMYKRTYFVILVVYDKLLIVDL